jgi:hypothetical protein
MARREGFTQSYTTANLDYTVTFALPQNYANLVCYLTMSDNYSSSYPNNAFAINQGNTGNDRCSYAYWVHNSSGTSTNRAQTSAYFPYMSKPRTTNLNASQLRIHIPNYAVRGVPKPLSTWSHGVHELSSQEMGTHGSASMIWDNDPIEFITFYPQQSWRAGCTLTVICYGDIT